MPINFRRTTILDSKPGGLSPWALGSGTSGYWNGTTEAENERINDTDPFGNTSIVWNTLPSGVVGSTDGGWIPSLYLNVDITKLYRFSVWIRKTSATNSGDYYFGCTGLNAHVDTISTGVSNTNPYWSYSSISVLTLDTWYLFVGHVFPEDTVTSYGVNIHPNSGKWTIAGGKGSWDTNNMGGGDVKFNASTTGIRPRTFHYNSSSSAAHLQFFDPRIELCDGSEGTVESLLAGDTNAGNLLDTTSVTNEGRSFKHQKVVATGGDEI